MVATGALGWVRERGPGDGQESAERGDPGGLGISLVWLEVPGCHAGAGGGVVSCARADTQLLLLLAGGRRRCCPCGPGQNRSWARQVSQVRPCLFYFLFVLFSIFFEVCFEFGFQTNQFLCF